MTEKWSFQNFTKATLGWNPEGKLSLTKRTKRHTILTQFEQSSSVIRGATDPCCAPAALIHLPASRPDSWADMKTGQSAFTMRARLTFFFFQVWWFLGVRGPGRGTQPRLSAHPARVLFSLTLPERECGTAEPGDLDGKDGCSEGKRRCFLLKKIGR